MADSIDQNVLFKSLAKLKGIKSNIDLAVHYTKEKYVQEYNKTAKDIAGVLKDNLDTFLVPASEIAPKFVGSSPSTGKRYSSDNWTETRFLLTKLDSLINYLEMLLGDNKPKQPTYKS